MTSYVELSKGKVISFVPATSGRLKFSPIPGFAPLPSANSLSLKDAPDPLGGTLRFAGMDVQHIFAENLLYLVTMFAPETISLYFSADVKLV